ncbi:MAG: twin-arginine translocase subunit TatC, partial [Barnesiella sp.]
GFMRRYRKHAIVIILVVAAIITPTSDVFTLSLVALPMWVLYEVSILIVSMTVKHNILNSLSISE